MVYIPIYWVSNAFFASAGLPRLGLLPMGNDLASLGNETNIEAKYYYYNFKKTKYL